MSLPRRKILFLRVVLPYYSSSSSRRWENCSHNSLCYTAFMLREKINAGEADVRIWMILAWCWEWKDAVLLSNSRRLVRMFGRLLL